MSTVSRARPGGPSFAADNKRVRITIGNGSRVEVMHGQMVSESANWIIHTELYRAPHPASEKGKQWHR